MCTGRSHEAWCGSETVPIPQSGPGFCPRIQAGRACKHALPEEAFDLYGDLEEVGLFKRALPPRTSESMTSVFLTARFEGSEKNCLSPGRDEKGRLPPQLSAGNPKSAKPLGVEPSSPLGEWTDPALPLENQV